VRYGNRPVHISDGLLPIHAWTAGYAVAGAALGLDLRRVQESQIPRLALLGSAFFVASLVHMPIGPASVHLTLNGLVGIVAGPGTILVIAMGLALQAILFGHGGLTTLGVNILNMALPALLLGGLARRGIRKASPAGGVIIACLIGALVPAVSLAMVWGWAVTAEDPAYTAGLQVLALAHVPVCILEGLICGATIAYLRRVQPTVLGLRSLGAGDRCDR